MVTFAFTQGTMWKSWVCMNLEMGFPWSFCIGVKGALNFVFFYILHTQLFKTAFHFYAFHHIIIIIAVIFFWNDHNKRTTAAAIVSFISYMYAALMIAGVIYDCMLSFHLVYFHLWCGCFTRYTYICCFSLVEEDWKLIRGEESCFQLILQWISVTRFNSTLLSPKRSKDMKSTRNQLKREKLNQRETKSCAEVPWG